MGLLVQRLECEFVALDTSVRLWHRPLMTKEQLCEAVLNSKSITGVLNYLKMNVSGSNHKKIKELI